MKTYFKKLVANILRKKTLHLSFVIYVATFSFNNICISSSVGGVVQNFLAKDGSKAIRCMMRWKEKAIKPAF